MQDKPLGDIQRRRRPAVLHTDGGDIGQQLFRPTHHLPEVQVALHEENHVAGMVVPPGKRRRILAAEPLQLLRVSQDIASQRMSAEYQVFEIVEYQFRRVVLVRLNLVDNDFRFFGYLAFGKSGVEDNIRQQFESASEVLGKEGGVNYRLLLIGIGVEVAAHILHPVQDVPRLALGSPLEDEVLHKVSHTLFVFQFVARTGVYGKATISHLGRRRFVDDAQPVSQRMQIALRIYFFY